MLKFEISGAFTAETLIIPVFVESLAELPKFQKPLDSVKILPHMGARHAVTWVYGHSGQEDLMLLGLGEAAKFRSSFIREAAGNAGRALLKEKRRTAAVSFEGLLAAGLLDSLHADDIAAWVEGSLLGTYSFDKYKAKPLEGTDVTVYFIGEDSREWTEAIRLGQVRAESTMWARDLANEPPNCLRPRDLAERTAERFIGTLAQVTIHEGEALERLGFAGLAAVGKGSVNPPVFLELRYCTDAAKPLVALIGKGITFDTGGISLKRDNDISDMRMDMAGAAAGALEHSILWFKAGRP